MACYSDVQLAAALRKAGVGAGDAAFLVATAHPESGGCGVEQQGQPYSTTGWGPWQITPGNSEPQCGTNSQLFGLEAAACAAAAKLKSQGLGAWTTITSGAYSAFFGKAKSAVSQVYSMSPSQVDQLVAGAKSGTTSAQTTAFNPLNPFGNIGSDILGGIASSLGLPSPKDMMIRLGLVILGGLMLLVAIGMMAGKPALQVAESKAVP
jgi:hypothetical protein